MSSQNRVEPSGKVPRRKRARPLPANVNARNLATEKRKRCEMKEKLLDLARLVPSLTNARRLNKVLIVNESIKHFSTQREMCLNAAEDMQAIVEENQRLTAELNTLRSQVGEPLIEPLLITEAMTQLMSVKNEVYGEFINGFGDNWTVETNDVQRSRNGTADQEQQLALDGFFSSQLSPPGEVASSNISFPMPPVVTGVIPVPLSEHVDAPSNPMSTVVQAQPPHITLLDLNWFTPETALIDDDQFATISQTLDFDLSSSLWQLGMNMSHAQTYGLNGTRQGDKTRLT